VSEEVVVENEPNDVVIEPNDVTIEPKSATNGYKGMASESKGVTSVHKGVANESNGVAVTSLVLGITSFGLMWIPVAGIIPPILAIVFGGMGISRANKIQSGMGMAVAGLVLGIVVTIWKAFPVTFIL
jgi:hypothetical protein